MIQRIADDRMITSTTLFYIGLILVATPAKEDRP